MHSPPPPDFEFPMISLFGGVFFIIVLSTSLWSLWQRRHAWGWWESPITLTTILVSVGVLALLPMIFWRQTSWWAWSYMLSYMAFTGGLSYFILALKRRQRHGPLPTNWMRNHVIAPNIVGTAAAWFFFYNSGAWHTPNLLLQDSTHHWSTPHAFAFWISVDIVGFYCFLRIAILLLKLKADMRRGDSGPVTVYLGSAVAGMSLCVIGVLVGTHHGLTASIFAVIVVLLMLLFAPQVWMSGFSWRAKRRRLVSVD